ncbi:SRPBCC family protein [Streptomyces sp. MAR4 CNX-425]|uniref:SRPBCC family protein n=1 Tax=Streptomyces sp. MAR4 CNX-425 TaxID=3406343 RepID=UPI003B5127F6
MIKAEYAFDLPVPPRDAFAVLSDPARDPEWQSACVETRLLNGAAQPGCRYEITFRLLGRHMVFTVEIDEFEPGRRSRFHTLSGPFSYIGTYAYAERAEGGTRVHWTFEVEPGDYFGVMPGALLRKVLVNQVQKDSGKLAGELAHEAGTRP